MNDNIDDNLSVIEEDIEEIIYDKQINWKSMANTTILVTGATGLIGSLIVKTLLRVNEIENTNITILALIRNIEKAKLIFSNSEYNNDVLEFYLQDVNEVIKVDKKVEFIIHTASITTSKVMIQMPVETLMTSVNGTKNILDFAKMNNIKSMVYISSMEVYGETDKSLSLIKESNIGYINILDSRSSYSEGKRTCECLCNAYNKEYGIPVKIARLAQTFGAGVMYNDTRVFAQFAKQIINNENIVLHTDGESIGNYCYTSDAIRGIFYLLLNGRNANAYNIVNEINTMKIKEMAQLLIDNINNNVKLVYDIPSSNIFGYNSSTTMRLSSEKIRELKWIPKYCLLEMYQRLIKSWKINGNNDDKKTY